jgi:long-chain fatty acid transport protein
MQKWQGLGVFFLVILFCSNGQEVFAVGSGGFENASFSAESLAQGNAVVAQATEPAAISYNPAGITQLPGIQVQGNTAFISIFTRQSHDNAVMYSSGTLSFAPTAYLTINPGKLLGDRVVFGIGSDSPFGLANKYDSNDPPVHYTGWNNYLKMFTIKPVMAIKITDWWSIGVGPMWYRIFKFGGIQAYPNQLLGAPFPDGQVRVDLKGNSWGWQIGTLLKPFKKHQFGFYFRSPVNLLLKGQAKVENATIGGNFETGSWAKLNLPLNFTFAYAFKPTDRTTFEIDFGYTRWSTLKRLYFNTDPVDPANDAILQAIGKADKDYRDGFSLQLGANHRISKKWTIRGGWLFYWNVVPEDHYIPAVPDANSMGLTLGVGYEILKNLNLDLAYFNRFWFRRTINNDISEVIGTSVDGKYFSYGQEFIISLTYKFDPFKWGKSNKADIETMPLHG